ncbi:hypothetical protein IFT48_00570 [Pseudomonas fluorescens]|uniref:hypothetical protein n=1 Tax=Pseudomonas TaxID=286 RepID=UPI000F02161F|nr:MULTISPECIES: hypothetical protein [Pseudomonas]MBD8088484.1 hypothetical protein [Pseudomonas fluorescens]MBD8615069.1 hypothetical protein [Pseudomonas putida]MBD8681255.1 hypothetical protein [Pseudomonas sp. CFBP 13719]
MSQPSKIRPKHAHRELFAFTPFAHNTIEHFLKTKMPISIFMALQVTEPEMVTDSKLKYQDLVQAINEVALQFGCAQDDCPEALVDQEIDAKTAYGIIHSAASRAAMNCETREKMISLAEPLAAMIEKLEQFGVMKPCVVDFMPRMVSSYKHVAAMSFRRTLDDLPLFDEARAAKQASISCKRALGYQDFDHLPTYFSKPLYEHLARTLGSRHGQSQAEARLAQAETFKP